MKKTQGILWTLVLIFALTGCGKKENRENIETEQVSTEAVVDAEQEMPEETETEVKAEIEVEAEVKTEAEEITPTEVDEETKTEEEPEIEVLAAIEYTDDYTTAIKTVYSNEVADYEVWAQIPYWNTNIHYRIANMPTNGEISGSKNVSIVTFANANEDEDAIRVRVWAYDNIASSQIDLKNMTDMQLGTLDGKNPDLSTMEKNETATTYTVGVQFELQDFRTTCMAYNYYVNDYENDKAYYVTVHASGKYSNYEYLYNLAHSVEVIELGVDT